MIKLSNVVATIDKSEVYYDFEIPLKSKVAIVGESGSGKTTLLNIISGFITPDKGEIFIDGKNITKSKPNQRPISLIFQSNNLFPHLSIKENINLAFGKVKGLSSDQNKQITDKLKFFGLEGIENNMPDQISGGQAQRATIIRALLSTTPVLLMDEPFSSLDYDNRIKLQNHLDQMVTEKKITLLMVTHHLDEIIDLIDMVIHIKEGKVEKISFPKSEIL